MGDFSRFRVLGFGVIFRHSVIPPFRVLGSPLAEGKQRTFFNTTNHDHKLQVIT